MLVKDFIMKELPVLKSFDTVEYALAIMDDYKLKHLPLVNDGGIYRCLISEKDLLTIPEPSGTIGEPVLFAPSIRKNSHLHEALSIMTRYGLSLLPVVTTDGVYTGAITRDKLIDALSELCNAEAEGSIIVLEMMPQDYVLSDIARLVESNNAHVLNLLSHQDKETGRLLISIKIDLEDASPVIRSFERFNYTVLYHFMEKGMVDNLLQQRMNELLHYMNM
ncbi:CBS domain-containing protein [Parabacteroides bouchesdurhonensis]|uniref:CBS domain-containing protein n=1 Tax=Parabacteroides bouchesdurhonensis TaxID=1936995 RepID=UPI000C84B143|nr:CBS domain-containing protein [Parabacteroides bouchesdurhonensis]